VPRLVLAEHLGSCSSAGRLLEIDVRQFLPAAVLHDEGGGKKATGLGHLWFAGINVSCVIALIFNQFACCKTRVCTMDTDYIGSTTNVAATHGHAFLGLPNFLPKKGSALASFVISQQLELGL